MHDQLAMRLQDDLTHAIDKKGAKGVLIDIPHSKWSIRSSAA